MNIDGSSGQVTAATFGMFFFTNALLLEQSEMWN